MSEELKPCPFCGSGDVSVYRTLYSGGYGGHDSVKCYNCGVFGPISHVGKDDAIKTWNNRTGGEYVEAKGVEVPGE